MLIWLKNQGMVRYRTFQLRSTELILASRKAHSVRVARVAMAISDGNPFKKVLEMINKTIGVIEAEEADDVKKKDTCAEEQETNEKNKADKEVDIQTLESNIDSIEVAIEVTIGDFQRIPYFRSF